MSGRSPTNRHNGSITFRASSYLPLSLSSRAVSHLTSASALAVRCEVRNCGEVILMKDMPFLVSVRELASSNSKEKHHETNFGDGCASLFAFRFRCRG